MDTCAVHVEEKELRLKAHTRHIYDINTRVKVTGAALNTTTGFGLRIRFTTVTPRAPTHWSVNTA